MPDPDPVVLLWGLLAVLAAWTGIPAAVAACGGARYANGGEEDPAALEPDGADPVYAERFAALARLGYRPVGPGFMRLTFAGPRWSVRTAVRAFRHESARQFAFVQVWPPAVRTGLDELFFAACFRGDRLLLTDNTIDHRDAAGPDYVRVGRATDDVAEQEAAHRAAVAGLRADGWEPDADTSLDALLRATAVHGGRRVTETLRAQGFNHVLTGAWCVGLPLVLATFMFGRNDWTVPVAGLIGLGLLHILDAAGRHTNTLAVHAARRNQMAARGR